MVTLTVTVGLPGSGKSDYCKWLAKETGAILVSISDIRYQKKKENPAVTEKEIFAEAHEQVRELLYHGYDCILDGSHTTGKKRKYLLKHLKELLPGIPFRAVCVVIATPIERCFWNNILKGNPVKPEVIGDAYLNWQTPGYWEGWNEIWAYYADINWIGIRGHYGDFSQDHINFDLADKPEFDSLGGHCNSVYNHLLRLIDAEDDEQIRNKALLVAALFHDCGKPIVQKVDGDKGNKALYYHHSNVGAYESLFYDIGDNDPVYVSNLINYHMEPHDWAGNPGAKGYAIKKFGGEFVADLLVLNQADKLAKKGDYLL